MPQQFQFDVLIIGSGAAGLSLALRLPSDLRIALVAKKDIDEGCTMYAQGGVSAVLDAGDSIESHVADTLNTGGGLCDRNVAQHTAAEAKAQIQWLIDQGVPFTQEQGVDGATRYHLTREGGHSHRRVVHAADSTGRAIETTLVDKVRRRSNVQLFERHIAIDLITSRKLRKSNGRCLGAYILDRDRGKVRVFRARFTVLATGGASKVYLYTTNPDVSTGDGIAMAWRAGCRVANLEFIQFHPTCLYHPKAKTFLVTEAVRGEGGMLLLPDGTRFMQRFDPRGELAPRDIVARAIDHEMKRLGIPHVLLDISHKPADFIKSHFPTIHARCLEFGIDMTRQPIPVVPAAHYTCGGVLTDLHGLTDTPNLYAIGETAQTGLHGANRLASNSLLECLVFGAACAADITARSADTPLTSELPEWDESQVTDSDEEVVVAHNWDELRRFMWDYVGIVRTDKRLERAKHRVDLLTREINDYYWNFRVTNDLLELRNLVVVADLIIRCAMARKESRGLHYTLNYPQADATHTPQNTVLIPPNYVPAST